MPTQEIASADWELFCERFADLHRGSLMTLWKIEADGRRREIAREMPLAKAWMERDGCNDILVLDFEQDRRREVMHRIVQPIHVKLREEGEGQKGLQIDAEDGTTLVQFRSGKLGELLSGMGRLQSR